MWCYLQSKRTGKALCGPQRAVEDLFPWEQVLVLGTRSHILYLLILVGSDRGEDSLREAEHLEYTPAGTEQVVCLNDVKARLVAVHGVKDNLVERERTTPFAASLSRFALAIFCSCQPPQRVTISSL